LFHWGFPGEVAVVVVPQGTRNEREIILYPAHCTGIAVWDQQRWLVSIRQPTDLQRRIPEQVSYWPLFERPFIGI
jgi:hypothetical protein